MSFKKQTNPLTAPWPPGMDWRIVHIGPKKSVFQLRWGAILPRHWYLFYFVTRRACSHSRAVWN